MAVTHKREKEIYQRMFQQSKPKDGDNDEDGRKMMMKEDDDDEEEEVCLLYLYRVSGRATHSVPFFSGHPVQLNLQKSNGTGCSFSFFRCPISPVWLLDSSILVAPSGK